MRADSTTLSTGDLEGSFITKKTMTCEVHDMNLGAIFLSLRLHLARMIWPHDLCTHEEAFS